MTLIKGMKFFVWVVFLLLVFSKLHGYLALSQERETSKQSHLRGTLDLLNRRISSLQSIFLSPKNIYIETGDAANALVQLQELGENLKIIEGRVEIMEYQIDLQLSEINLLIGEIKNKIGMGLHEYDKDRASNNKQLNQELFLENDNPMLEGYSSLSKNKILETADNAFENGDYERAKTNYKKYIDKFPDSPRLPEVFYKLAKLNYKTLKWKEAANAYLEAFSLKPKGKLAPSTLIGLSKSLGALKEFEQACLTLEEVQLRFPDQRAISSEQIKQLKKSFGCV